MTNEIYNPKIVSFKSTPENFRKEMLGLKRNTIRKTDNIFEDRFLLLHQFMRKEIPELYIIIINSESGKTFTRNITDVTVWEGIYIISW